MVNPLAHFSHVEAMLETLQPSDPVYCLYPDEIRRTARHFVEAFPGNTLYAVKCNPHPEVLAYLHEAGVRHFDTASLSEVIQIHNQFPDAGLYFMHPVKSRQAIATAYIGYGVRTFVVDHKDELDKVLQETGGSDVIIMVRLATPNSGASFNLSSKFGASPTDAARLLKIATERGVGVGICFHVGSQCTSEGAFYAAIGLVHRVMGMAGLDRLDYLDVGGGFPAQYLGSTVTGVDVLLQEIREGLNYFGFNKGCTVICEPGRALIATGMSVVTRVQLRKGGKLYLNDGIYGSFQETTSGIQYPARLIRPGGGQMEKTRSYTIYGPTCDSTDILSYKVELPTDVREGDWIEFSSMGAYSLATRTNFNGFYADTFVTIDHLSARTDQVPHLRQEYTFHYTL